MFAEMLGQRRLTRFAPTFSLGRPVGRGNAALFTQGLDKPSVCPQFPTPDYGDDPLRRGKTRPNSSRSDLLQSLLPGVRFPVRQWSRSGCLSLLRQYGGQTY